MYVVVNCGLVHSKRWRALEYQAFQLDPGIYALYPIAYVNAEVDVEQNVSIPLLGTLLDCSICVGSFSSINGSIQQDVWMVKTRDPIKDKSQHECSVHVSCDYRC
ncbi:hypothetical protein K7X08_020774 [Anisodus acutangulus]|uniref:Uncharacterized protein n=1 Tax=Anisodus acutangulus TaxID=402998 RepID=A0A9Q1MZ42_9SOLA|nr:hypothetical protein K7X08_020774 [Anisodus acutangulus]